MDEKIFDRIEKKYLITKSQKTSLLRDFKLHMQNDVYYKSEVYNIYFDTKNYDLIIKSIESPTFKEKLRARSYGGYDKVFFEIKTKLKGKENNIGYKRRVLITHKDYDKFIAHQKTMEQLATKNLETPSDLQIAREVDYLVSYFDLKPKILVYYDRESYVGENNLRITFDENLSYRANRLSFTRRVDDQYYFKNNDTIIMELKAHGVIPLWLAKTLSKNHAYPTQFSKIGKIYAKINERSKNV